MATIVSGFTWAATAPIVFSSSGITAHASAALRQAAGSDNTLGVGRSAESKVVRWRNAQIWVQNLTPPVDLPMCADPNSNAEAVQQVLGGQSRSQKKSAGKQVASTGLASFPLVERGNGLPSLRTWGTVAV